MSTKRSHFVYAYVKLKRFRLPLLIPLRILWELHDALEDLTSLCGRTRAKVDPAGAVRFASGTVYALAKLGRFDLIDVDAGREGERVKVKVCLR